MSLIVRYSLFTLLVSLECGVYAAMHVVVNRQGFPVVQGAPIGVVWTRGPNDPVLAGLRAVKLDEPGAGPREPFLVNYNTALGSSSGHATKVRFGEVGLFRVEMIDVDNNVVATSEECPVISGTVTSSFPSSSESSPQSLSQPTSSHQSHGEPLTPTLSPTENRSAPERSQSPSTMAEDKEAHLETRSEVLFGSPQGDGSAASQPPLTTRSNAVLTSQPIPTDQSPTEPDPDDTNDTIGAPSKDRRLMIIGAIVGSITGLILIALLMLLVCRSRRARRSRNVEVFRETSESEGYNFLSDASKEIGVIPFMLTAPTRTARIKGSGFKPIQDSALVVTTSLTTTPAQYSRKGDSFQPTDHARTSGPGGSSTALLETVSSVAGSPLEEQVRQMRAEILVLSTQLWARDVDSSEPPPLYNTDAATGDETTH